MSDKPEYGNAQKMREALGNIVLTTLKVGMSMRGDVACGIIASRAKAALAAPPRNCDVGTAEEQLERFMAFCKNYPRCSKCPCCGIGRCVFVWGQMPYEKEEK